MAKSIKKWMKALRYREEATVICLLLLTVLSCISTLAMFFIEPDKAILLLIVSVVLLLALIYYRTHRHIHLRASITTLRRAHATRKKHRRTQK